MKKFKIKLKKKVRLLTLFSKTFLTEVIEKTNAAKVVRFQWGQTWMKFLIDSNKMQEKWMLVRLESLVKSWMLICKSFKLESLFFSRKRLGSKGLMKSSWRNKIKSNRQSLNCQRLRNKWTSLDKENFLKRKDLLASEIVLSGLQTLDSPKVVSLGLKWLLKNFSSRDM